MTNYEPESLSEDFGDAPDQITRLRQRVEQLRAERDSLAQLVIDGRKSTDREDRKEALDQALRYNQIVPSDTSYDDYINGNISVEVILKSAKLYAKFLSGEATN